MSAVNVIIWILEISYTIVWSVSFYFQAWTTYKCQRGDGYSLDFQYLNILGFGYYAGYNIYDFFHNDTAAEGIMDMIFSIHAFLISLFLLGQTYYYPRSLNKINVSAVGTIVIVLIAVVFYALMDHFVGNFSYFISTKFFLI